MSTFGANGLISIEQEATGWTGDGLIGTQGCATGDAVWGADRVGGEAVFAHKPPESLG